jgi:uncharacterized protein (DUF58 family)
MHSVGAGAVTGEPLRAALLAGKRRPRARGGGSPTKYRGDGYEFVEVREYVAGDDPRRIDWAATARSGDLQTRVVLEDVALTLAAIVDDSASMRVGVERELATAANEAVGAWFAAARADDRCIRIFADEILAPALRGAPAATACTLARGHAPFDLMRACAAARAGLPRGSALLVVTDAFGLPDDADRRLSDLGQRCDATVLLARDPWHRDLPLRGFTRVEDVETGERRTVLIDASARRRYVEAVRLREERLRARFEAAGWRVGTLCESGGRASLLDAFGVSGPAA